MGSDGSRRVNADELWERRDKFDYEERGFLGDSIIDNGLFLFWNLKMVVSHA